MEVRSESAETILIVDDDELVRISAATPDGEPGLSGALRGQRLGGPGGPAPGRRDRSSVHRRLHARRNAWPATRGCGAPAAAGTEDSLHIRLFRIRGDPSRA